MSRSRHSFEVRKYAALVRAQRSGDQELMLAAGIRYDIPIDLVMGTLNRYELMSVKFKRRVEECILRLRPIDRKPSIDASMRSKRPAAPAARFIPQCAPATQQASRQRTG